MGYSPANRLKLMNAPIERVIEPAASTQASRVTHRRWYALIVLTLVYAFNIADRYVISTLIEPIKADLRLSDTAIGFLTGTALAIFYTGMGIPLGVIADRVDRRKLIALSLAIWSAMTSLCGAAANFTQLMLARIGVGTGEAGGTPASQSLLADLFPFANRVLATSVFTLGAAAGSMLGSVAGGRVADAYGWRMAFVALGLPGLLLALLVRATLAEPPRTATSAAAEKPPSFLEALRFIGTQRALIHVMAGATVITYWGWGLLWWTPAFLSRSHGLSTGDAGARLGTITGLAGALGVVLGGLIIHRLGRHDARWQVWIVAIATLLGTGASMVAYATPSLGLATLMLWVFVPVAYLNLAPLLSLTQSLVPPRMRGLSCAILLFGANVANLALAPQLIGFMSDSLRSEAGNESLRWALVINSVTGLWAAYHFVAAGRWIRHDLRRAGVTI